MLESSSDVKPASDDPGILVKPPETLRAELRADHLDGDLALPGAVELREDDRLEAAERQLAVVEADRDGAPEQRGAQVAVGVAALAVREARVVVAIAPALGHQLLDEPLEVVDEGALELVDEERAGGVERVDEGDPRRDGELLDGLPHELGDVRDLGAFLTTQRERGVENLHPLSLPGHHLVFASGSASGAASEPPA